MTPAWGKVRNSASRGNRAFHHWDAGQDAPSCGTYVDKDARPQPKYMREKQPHNACNPCVLELQRRAYTPARAPEIPA